MNTEEQQGRANLLMHYEISIDAVGENIIELNQWEIPDGPNSKITLSRDQITPIISALEFYLKNPPKGE